MSNRSLKPPRTPHRSKPPRTPHRADRLPSLSPDDAGQALTPASLKHVRRQRDKVSEENQRLRQDLEKLSAEHAQLQKDHQVLIDQHGLCAEGAARFAALQKAHTALQTTLDAEVEATAARLKEAPAAHDALRAAEATVERLKRELKLQAEQYATERDEMSSMARLAMQAQKDAALHVKSAMDKDKLERAERERAQREYVNSVQEEMQQSLAKMNLKFDKLKNEALMALLNKKLCVHVLAPKTWLLSGNIATGYGPSQMQTDEIRAVVDREVLPHFQSVFAMFGAEERSFETDAAPAGSKATNCQAYAQLFAESVTKFVKHALERTDQNSTPTAEEIAGICSKESAPRRAGGAGAKASDRLDTMNALKAKYMGMAEARSSRQSKRR